MLDNKIHADNYWTILKWLAVSAIPDINYEIGALLPKVKSHRDSKIRAVIFQYPVC